jgi:uncharacterized protein YjiK
MSSEVTTQEEPICGEAHDLSPMETYQRQTRILLHALNTGHPVLYQQRQRFIHTLTFQQSGGSVEAIVYLSGEKTAVPPMDVSLDLNHRRIYSLK